MKIKKLVWTEYKSMFDDMSNYKTDKLNHMHYEIKYYTYEWDRLTPHPYHLHCYGFDEYDTEIMIPTEATIDDIKNIAQEHFNEYVGKFLENINE